MKLITLFISFFLLASPDLASVRKQYIGAGSSEQDAAELFKTMEAVSDESGNHTMLAYKAAAYTLKAKYEKGLLNKKNLFTKGAKMLEGVIKKDPSNYEARLLRLSIQENAPKITGYNKDIEEDKKFILTNYSNQKQDLKEFAKGFVNQSALFSASDKAALK